MSRKLPENFVAYNKPRVKSRGYILQLPANKASADEAAVRITAAGGFIRFHEYKNQLWWEGRIQSDFCRRPQDVRGDLETG